MSIVASLVKVGGELCVKVGELVARLANLARLLGDLVARLASL